MASWYFLPLFYFYLTFTYFSYRGWTRNFNFFSGVQNASPKHGPSNLSVNSFHVLTSLPPPTVRCHVCAHRLLVIACSSPLSASPSSGPPQDSNTGFHHQQPLTAPAQATLPSSAHHHSFSPATTTSEPDINSNAAAAASPLTPPPPSLCHRRLMSLSAPTGIVGSMSSVPHHSATSPVQQDYGTGDDNSCAGGYFYSSLTCKPWMYVHSFD